jgi:translation elongation factor P/translation initiation factor 5A
MNYECKSKTGKLSATCFGEVHSTNEWYHIIRNISSGDAKQWKNVVVAFKAAIAKGELVKSTKASTGAVKKATKAKATKAATAAVANAVQNAKQKAPKAILKKVNYQVSDPNDTRYWTYRRLFFNTEAERDAEIEKIKADSNKVYVSKGWGERQYSVGFWQVKEAKNG